MLSWRTIGRAAIRSSADTVSAAVTPGSDHAGDTFWEWNIRQFTSTTVANSDDCVPLRKASTTDDGIGSKNCNTRSRGRNIGSDRGPYAPAAPARILLLERCPTFGGLTRTVEVGEFCFDYTGHFLHLTRYASPEDIPYANLKNNEWAQIGRRSCCYVGEKMNKPLPIQYNLAELPPHLFARCVESYNQRPSISNSENATFRDFIVSGFGQTLADLFLIPQNEKTMAIPLDRLSKHAVRRFFFPAPDEKLVRMGIVGRVPIGNSYNSTFWYPKAGGIGRLVQGLRAGVENCLVNQDVVAVNLQAKTVCTRTQGTFRWDAILSSIPLKSFCEMTNDEELRSASAMLSHSSTISFNIGIRGPLRPEFADVHWLYVPDRTIPFYRIGFYSNIGKGACAAGHKRDLCRSWIAVRRSGAD